MIPTPITDHEAHAVALLAEEFKEDPGLLALLAALSAQAQEIETALVDCLTLKSIAVSVGAQLDLIGKIIGQPRIEATDAVYRKRLVARVLINRCNGTVEEILGVFQVLESTAILKWTDAWPAGFVLEILGAPLVPPVPSVYAGFVDECRGAGIKAWFGWSEWPDAEMFFTDDCTYLTVAALAGDTEVTVEDTSRFPATGSIILSPTLGVEETCTYTAKTPTKFTGVALPGGLANPHALGAAVSLPTAIGKGHGSDVDPALGGRLSGVI